MNSKLMQVSPGRLPVTMRNIKAIFSMLVLVFIILAVVMPSAASAQGLPPDGPPPGASQPPSMPPSVPPSVPTSVPTSEPQQEEPGTGQPPNGEPSEMQALPAPAQVGESGMSIARAVVDGSALNLLINQGCYATYYVKDWIQFSVAVGDWSVSYPQQSWWRYLEVWGSTNGAWWHPVISGRWVEPTDSIVESARISRPVGDELLYARLLDPQGNMVAWTTCEFTSGEAQSPVVTQDPVVTLLETGEGHAGAYVQHALVFRVKAYDPNMGTHDGAGIAYVDMEIYNWQGYKVYGKREGQAGYCAFGGGTPQCSVYRFGNQNYHWPNGTQVNPGEYTLKATAYTPDGRYTTLHKTITIQ